MTTPFDNKIWTVRSREPRGPINPELPFNSPTVNAPRNPTSTSNDLSGVVVVPHHPSPEAPQPLRSHTSFEIHITKNDSAKINFNDPAPDYIKTIWKGAQNVYYDREFYAIRGDLFYEAETCLASKAFAKHFMISYDGRMATAGSARQLTIELYDELSIATPTSKLLHRRFNIMTSHGGSWKADD